MENFEDAPWRNQPSTKVSIADKIGSFVQGNSDVTAYFDKLCRLWDEVDAMKIFKPCHSDGSCVETDKEIEEERIVKFLIGLSEDFNVVKSNVFATKQVSSIDVVFDMVTREEVQKKGAGLICMVVLVNI